MFCAALLAGCSGPVVGQGGSATADGGRPAGLLTSSPSGAPAPADLLSPALRSAAGGRRLSRAKDVLVSACMRDRGWTWTPPDPWRVRALDDETWVPDMELRRRFGYGSRLPDGPPEGDEVTSRGYVEALGGPSPDLRLEVAGQFVSVSAAGCLTSSGAALFGSPRAAAEAEYAPQLAAMFVLPRVEADPTMADLVRDWARCMRARGRLLASPEEARRRYSGTAEETAVALDDADCARDVDARARYRALVVSHLADLTLQDRTTLSRVAASWPAALARAERITAGRRP